MGAGVGAKDGYMGWVQGWVQGMGTGPGHRGHVVIYVVCWFGAFQPSLIIACRDIVNV